jgi:leader peptidase (prepilin peptidase)/N-methyltransferase
MFPDWASAALLAPCAGSLMGVLARRLPAGRPVLRARSECDSCHATLTAHELVPLLSYALQRGRCGYCGAPIGRYHLAMELACVAIALWAGAVFDGAALWASCILGWMLLALSVCDWENTVLPDALTLPLLLFGLVANSWLWPPSITDHALAAALGYLAFRILAVLYRRLRGREGLGGGDAKLLAAAGAWLGVAALPWVVLGAAIAGIALAGGLALSGRRVTGRTILPFGPCLAIAIWLVWLYG